MKTEVFQAKVYTLSCNLIPCMTSQAHGGEPQVCSFNWPQLCKYSSDFKNSFAKIYKNVRYAFKNIFNFCVRGALPQYPMANKGKS